MQFETRSCGSWAAIHFGVNLHSLFTLKQFEANISLVINLLCLSIFEWPFYTDFTVLDNSQPSATGMVELENGEA